MVAHFLPSVTREDYAKDYVAPAKCTNLADFLARAPRGIQLLQTPLALELVTKDVFGQLENDGVIYAELRFAPLLHTEQGLRPKEVVEIVDRTTEQMIRETGIEARLILCTLRHFTEAQSMETVRLVERFRGTRVAALDLAGDEAGYPIQPHIAAYRFAREKNLPRTAHAGEGCGPQSVWETLKLLDPARIGHGTRSSEDPVLIGFLRRERVHLELCPSSNVQIIPSIPEFAAHPIERLYRAGVPLNVNTDSRMLTPTTLTAEYEKLREVFGWGSEEFLQTNLMAIEAAFVGEEVKEKLRMRVKAAYGAS